MKEIHFLLSILIFYINLKTAKFAETSGNTKAISYAFTWGKI